jgi:PEP-CTERM motif
MASTSRLPQLFTYSLVWFDFMKRSTLATLVGATAVLLAASTSSAQAFEISTGGIYGIDAVGDGSGDGAEDMSYDIRGISMITKGNDAYVAITSNTPLTGNTYNGTNIGYGDLFFNFSGKKFNDAQGSLFGIRFSGTNDSKAPSMGVYSGVTATSVTAQNYGYSSLDQYYNEHGGQYDRANSQGTALATKEAAYNYYGQNGPIQNVIGSGSKIGDITALSLSDLSTAGFNFGSNAGNYTFGFKFNRSLLPNKDFMANLYLECGNDGVAIAGKAVPEPTTMAGLAIAGAGLIASRRRKSKQA